MLFSGARNIFYSYNSWDISLSLYFIYLSIYFKFLCYLRTYYCLCYICLFSKPFSSLASWFARQNGNDLAPMIARGVMLGPNQPVILHMLYIPPAAEALNGVIMELVDAAFPLLKGRYQLLLIVEACIGINIAIMVGGFSRKERMARKYVMSKNVSIYKSQASALQKHAATNCKVRVL